MTSTSKFIDPYLQRIHRIVQRDGLAIQAVLGDEMAPGWSYTIGLTERELPEILTVGLAPESAQFALNTAAAVAIAEGGLPATKDGRLTIAGVDACFLPVPAERWDDDDAFGLVASYYGPLGRQPASTGLQLVWPDGGGRFPWEDGFDDELRHLQPVLADGERIPRGTGGFHPDCACCRTEQAAQRQTMQATARKRRKARQRRRR